MSLGDFQVLLNRSRTAISTAVLLTAVATTACDRGPYATIGSQLKRDRRARPPK